MNTLIAVTMLFQGATSTDAKLAESCLAYSGCQVSAIVLPGRAADSYSLTIAGMDRAEAIRTLSLCGLGARLSGKLVGEHGEKVALPALNTPLLNPPSPAFLDDRRLAPIRDRLPAILEMAQTGDIVEASRQMIALFGLEDAGYVPVVKHPKDSPVTTTDHDTKRIELAARYPSACEYWWAIRHELEHVAQTRFAARCRARGQASILDLHRARELAAYAGDTAYASIACGAEESRGIELNSLTNILRYLQ